MSLAKRTDIEIIGEAENGMQLLNMLKHLQPDIIILNITMPIMDGLATLPELKKHYPKIKVIILSMHNDPSVICHMLELGASTYLTKEAGSDVIYESIIGCTTRQFYINETVRKTIASIKFRMPTIVKKGSPPPVLKTQIITHQECKFVQLLKEGKSRSKIEEILDESQREVAWIFERLISTTHTKTEEELVRFFEEKEYL